MRKVFADTFYFFALLSDQDEGHARALFWTESFRGRLVTSEWVLLELADGLAASRQRDLFVPLRRSLLADPNYQIIGLDPSLHVQGAELYAARPDKQWSLTDCISFVIMEQEGVSEALTGDQHFEQAGFTAILK